MKPEHKTILQILGQYLEKNPDIRFGQALFNLGITEFAAKDPAECNHQLRDIYADSDNTILNRIKLSEDEN